MLDRPKLSEERIKSVLSTSYHLPLAELEFLPLGADGQAAVYRVSAQDGRRYFLKVKTGKVNEAGLLVPTHLQQQGVRHLVAPLPTVDQALWQREHEFTLMLYPYVEGRSGLECGLSLDQWCALGARLRQIHATQVPPSLTEKLSCETFIPDWMDLVKRLIATIHEQTYSEPLAEEMANFWQQQATVIGQLVMRAGTLGQQLRKRALPHVLCHADIHAANLLLDSTSQLWIVDWDQTMLAPKERDLMFVIGGGVLGPIQPEEEAAFLQGYGNVVIDLEALAYYRYAWAVQDIGAFAEDVLARPELSSAAKAQALRYFKSLFDPGMIVETALQSKW